LLIALFWAPAATLTGALAENVAPRGHTRCTWPGRYSLWEQSDALHFQVGEHEHADIVVMVHRPRRRGNSGPMDVLVNGATVRVIPVRNDLVDRWLGDKSEFELHTMAALADWLATSGDPVERADGLIIANPGEFPDRIRLHAMAFNGSLWLGGFIGLFAVGNRVRLRVRTKDRIEDGLCPHCAYDLSATPGPICPECGRSAPSPVRP
jgi:hypothetical protein